LTNGGRKNAGEGGGKEQPGTDRSRDCGKEGRGKKKSRAIADWVVKRVTKTQGGVQMKGNEDLWGGEREKGHKLRKTGGSMPERNSTRAEAHSIILEEGSQEKEKRWHREGNSGESEISKSNM